MQFRQGQIIPDDTMKGNSLASAIAKRAPGPVSGACKNNNHQHCSGTRNDKLSRMKKPCECKCHKLKES